MPPSGGSSQKSTTTNIRTPQQLKMDKLRLRSEQVAQPYREAAFKALGGFFNPEEPSIFGLKASSPEEAQALRMMLSLSDITDLTKASEDIFNRVALPSLTGALSARGYGRSGYLGDTLTRAGQNMAMPLLNISRGAQGNLANYLANMGTRRFGPGLAALGTPTPFTTSPAATTTSTESGGGSFNPMGLLAPILSAGLNYLLPGAGSVAGAAMGGGSSGGFWSAIQPGQFTLPKF